MTQYYVNAIDALITNRIARQEVQIKSKRKKNENVGKKIIIRVIIYIIVLFNNVQSLIIKKYTMLVESMTCILIYI